MPHESEQLRQLLNNAAAIAKGQQDVLVLGQVHAVDKHVVLWAGGYQPSGADKEVRDCKWGADAWCIRSDLKRILAVAVS